ncbi:Gfo/Idh/MocA family oxidoreductase [Streptomyces sp. SID13031]|uniref:Gfo/Idh/MocA family protein n=1 Tax=Streptomyces sp. SID13031 TaxID=2706046 RepID=UPI0013C831A5|nr:Gfo/Idh/MocA family oxidoreductase [Streptomyces sp. SID13031]NEA34568.1 Gfo/Idh/MocA family oxidoreductase [Streptomyces sp. SID13031]
MTGPSASLPRVAVVGVHGHGASHVHQAAKLAAAGRCRLVALVDPRPPTPDQLAGQDLNVYPDLPALLQAEQVDLVVISTPIHTHAPLAELALRAGADVLLEKPPVASMGEFERLTRVLEETGRSCQVGFQAQGSGAVLALAAMVADGALGEIRGIGATGTWVRKQAYWQRARWAGRRTLDGVPVVDGVVTNAFAHSVAAALLVDGSGRAEEVREVETELYRANPIEADDTSTVRIRTTRGTSILAAFTLCAAGDSPPRVTVYGSDGHAVLRYMSDELEVGGTTTQYDRDDLLENLLDHRRDGVPLLSPLTETGGFTRVLDAIRSAPAPRPISADWEGSGDERHPVVPGVEKWIEQAAERQALFSELGAPWAGQPTE